jgi:hypothetical protein
MNPITIYMAVKIINFEQLANRFIGKDVTNFIGEPYAIFVRRTVQMLLVFAFLRFLYKKKIFIRM